MDSDRNKKMKESWMRSKALVGGILFLLVIVTLATSYYGSSDIGDYSDTAKFFAGDYSAKIRSSHSYLLGFIHAPFVGFIENYLAFKISSLIFLIILIFSVYIISRRDIRALWMMLLSPIIWYMAPWINPIQLASIFLLWAWHFMTQYHEEKRIALLIYSGMLIGIGWAFWDTIFYFGILLGVCFLFDKKLWHAGVFGVAILIGLLPRLILDQVLFNFMFFTTIKTFLSGFANLFGGIYDKAYGHTPHTLATLLPFILAIPFCFWRMVTSQQFREKPRTLIFLLLSLLLLLTNPQIRYILALAPIMIVFAIPHIEKKYVRFALGASTLFTLIVIIPYILQIGGTINGELYGAEITGTINKGVDLSNREVVTNLQEDLENIVHGYQNSTFLVGNGPDDYAVLAHFYWGRNVQEFVSIQDYDLSFKNESILYKKRFEPLPNILERRQFWIEGGLEKSHNDPTNYASIEYGIGLNEPLKSEGFTVIKKYNLLYLSKKV